MVADWQRGDTRKMNWTKLMLMNWPTVAWLRRDEDVDAAELEIKTVMGRNVPGNDELCATIRWMSGPDGRQEKAPSLRELIRAVYIRRKGDRGAAGREAEACALCRGGWSYLTNEWGGQTAIPCMCSGGDRVMDVVAEYKGMSAHQSERIQGMRRAGLDEAKRRAAA